MLFLVSVTIFVVLACVVVPGLTFALVLLVDDDEVLVRHGERTPVEPRVVTAVKDVRTVTSEGRGTTAAPSRPSLARRSFLIGLVRRGQKLPLLPSNEATGVR